MNLFELNRSYEELADREDLDPQVLSDTLDAIADSREVKVENICTMIDRLKAESSAMKDKIQAWQKEKKYRDNKISWLQAYLTSAMDQAGITHLSTANHIIGVRNFKARTVVDDETKLPGDYIDKRVEYRPDKKKLYADLMSGEKIPGVHLEENRKATIK